MLCGGIGVVWKSDERDILHRWQVAEKQLRFLCFYLKKKYIIYYLHIKPWHEACEVKYLLGHGLSQGIEFAMQSEVMTGDTKVNLREDAKV